MSILIKGIDIPTIEQGVRTINIYADGVVTNYAEVTIAHAVPVPPHGDLIDRDALLRGDGRYIIAFGREGIDVSEIKNAPTIIPEEPAEEV